MANIALLGYGRMGKAIEEEAKRRGHTVILKVGRSDVLTAEALSGCDVALEFAGTAAAESLVRIALSCGIPVVSGSTGWGFDELISDLQSGDSPAFLHATNFSPGVNAVFMANAVLAKALGNIGGYTATITETHHVHKLDAPSGTAVTLAEGVVGSLQPYTEWHLDAPDTPKSPESIVITSCREGEVIGDHAVSYSSEVDLISISHQAKNRTGFALGAVLAAEFVIGKKGCFTMQDVLS